MPLDIHVGKSGEPVSHTIPRISINESIHDRLFFSDPGRLKDLSFILRMADYYHNFIFLAKELGAVRKELAILRGRFAHDTEIQALLDALQGLCLQAETEGHNVYGLAD